MKIKKYEKLEVVWIDTISDNGWRFKGEFKDNDKEHECSSLGYFIQKTKYLTLCQSISPDEEADYISIPIKNVLKITRL